MTGERIVTYYDFMAVLAEAIHLDLCDAPYPDTIKNLTPGAVAVLSLEELGCDRDDLTRPYHHKVRAVLMYERIVHLVDITDAAWIELRTADEYFASLPVITIPAELHAELAQEHRKGQAADAAARLAEISTGLSERLTDDGTGDEPPSEEDGGSSVREPVPRPGPADDAGASIPRGVPVG